MATNKPARLTIEIDQASIAGAIADAIERIAFEIRTAHGLVGAAAEAFVGNTTVAADTTTDTLQFSPEMDAAVAAPVPTPPVASAPIVEPPPPAPAAFTGFAPADTSGQLVNEAPAAEPAAPPKRKRRTKAEIEADRIREANELIARQQAAAAGPQVPQAQAQIPQDPQQVPQAQAQIPQAAPQQFPPLAIQTSQAPAPGAVAPQQPTPSDWTPSWGYAQPEG